MKVLIFASHDAGGHAEAKALAIRVGAQFVDRLAARLEDLRLVARYGVVEPVCIVVLRKDVVVARIPRLIGEAELRADLASLAEDGEVR